MGHVCPNSSIVAVHLSQQFACLHGINTHVVSLNLKQTAHKFLFSEDELCANSIKSSSASSSEL